MAFETGTSTGVDDLVNVRLKAFLVANGWTNNDDNWPDFLAFSRGNCFVNMRRDIQTFNDSFNNAIVDHRVRLFVSSGYSGTGGTPLARYRSQPDATFSNTSTIENVPNDLTGPLANYYFFGSDSSDPLAYCHVVVETRAGYYTHFGFGEVDKGNATFSPNPSYSYGQLFFWWVSSSNLSFSANFSFSSGSHQLPFTDSDRGWTLWPAGSFTAPVISNAAGLLPNLRPDNDGANLNGAILDGQFWRGPSPVSGVTALFPIIMARNPPGNNVVHNFVGSLPDIRLCSLVSRSAGEEISFGDDTWQLFPFRRQAADGSVPAESQTTTPPFENRSGPYGIAFRKLN